MKYGNDERWADWSAWFEDSYQDVMGLTFNRYIWRNLIAMLQSNPDVEHHSFVNGYLTRSYAQMQAVGVRRQWDRSERRPTVGRLLYEMQQHPEAATRDRYVAGLEGDIRDPSRWRDFAPSDGGVIDVAVVKADADRLANETKDARDYVNKLVAHLGRDRKVGPIGSGDWFGDINRGIDVLGALIKKYWTLFHPGQMLATITPSTDLGWTRMFRTAWLSEHYVPVEADLGE